MRGILILIGGCGQPAFEFHAEIEAPAGYDIIVNEQHGTAELRQSFTSYSTAEHRVLVEVTIVQGQRTATAELTVGYCAQLATSQHTDLGSIELEDVILTPNPGLALLVSALDCEGTEGAIHITP